MSRGLGAYVVSGAAAFRALRGDRLVKPKFGRKAVLPPTLPKAKGPPNLTLLYKRAKHADAMLAKAQKRLKAATTVLARWQKRVKYYEKRILKDGNRSRFLATSVFFDLHRGRLLKEEGKEP